MLPNPVKNANTFDIQFDVKYNDYAKLSVDNKDACINNFKPTVISNIEFGSLTELQQSPQSGNNREANGKLTPYYFSSNGYSCTNVGFILKFTLAGFDDNGNKLVPRNYTFEDRNLKISNLLLSGAIITAIVYIDPTGIDVNTPFTTRNPFVDHTEACT